MMGEPEVVDPEPLSAARLKVQRTNWHKLAGNELMKIQNKIQTDRQKKIKEKWESNRLKNLEVMKQRAEDDAGLSPHPADVIRKYNYKIRPNTQPVRFGKVCLWILINVMFRYHSRIYSEGKLVKMPSHLPYLLFQTCQPILCGFQLSVISHRMTKKFY